MIHQLQKINIIKEQDVVREDINSKIIDDVAKFKAAGHVYQLQRSDNSDIIDMLPKSAVVSKKRKKKKQQLSKNKQVDRSKTNPNLILHLTKKYSCHTD